jgi:hypothetical protein
MNAIRIAPSTAEVGIARASAIGITRLAAGRGRSPATQREVTAAKYHVA